MSFRIVWTTFALQQLELIHEFISLDSESAADKICDGIVDAIDPLMDFPLSGTIEARFHDLAFEYRYLVHSHYKIIYRVEDAAVIVIVNVFDTRQDPSKMRIG